VQLHTWNPFWDEDVELGVGFNPKEAGVEETKIIQRWETRDEACDRAIQRYRDVIETKFGTPLKETQTHIMTHMPGLPTLLHMMAADPEGKLITGFDKKERDELLKEFPKLRVWPITNQYALVDTGSNDNDVSVYSTTLYSAPVAVEGLDLGLIIVMGYRVKFANGVGEEEMVLITRKEVSGQAIAGFVAQFNKIVKKISHEVRRIQIWGEPDSPEIPKQSWTTWDQIFLEPNVAQAVRDDLFFFINNEQAFRDAEIPYKRGYLIHGPPGNGKTTICRAIATSMSFATFGFDFSNSEWENRDLSQAFRNAVAHAPAAFFLEDIDRVWEKDDGSNETKITMDHLLNCLDGIQTNDGLIVIATANNPKVIDPAILSRPGRFDAIVELKNPSFDLRKRYLKYLFRKTELGDDAFTQIAEDSDGVSMSYVKEIFILSMRSAIEHRRKVCGLDTAWAVEKVMDMFTGADNVAHREAGFGR
jgi:SpoVK/Ycf46/Vps4 family AAA+-type ATPase